MSQYKGLYLPFDPFPLRCTEEKREEVLKRMMDRQPIAHLCLQMGDPGYAEAPYEIRLILNETPPDPPKHPMLP